MAAATAGELHYTILASAETLAGRAGALLRRCVCWARRSGTKAGEWGDYGARATAREARVRSQRLAGRCCGSGWVLEVDSGVLGGRL